MRLTCNKMEVLRARSNDYQNLKISKTAFTNAKQITNTVYGKCILQLTEMYNCDAVSTCLSVECFRQCLLTVNAIYAKHAKEVIEMGEFFSFE